MQPGKELGFVLTLIYLGLDPGYLACGFSVRWLAARRPVVEARRVVFLSATALLWLAAAAPHLADARLAVGGSGSLAGALAMWAVGRVTQQTGSFAGPMAAVAVAGGREDASAPRGAPPNPARPAAGT